MPGFVHTAGLFLQWDVTEKYTINERDVDGKMLSIQFECQIWGTLRGGYEQFYLILGYIPEDKTLYNFNVNLTFNQHQSKY
jgi:hypothetical protein